MAEGEDELDLALVLKRPTTIREVQREIVLNQVKEKLGITQAEWLRLQQEIRKFLKLSEGKDRTDEDAALLYLNDTGAKDRFFGLLAGGEAEGMLVNRAGLAWGIDDDEIVALVAAVVAAWRSSVPLRDDGGLRTLTKRSAPTSDNSHQTKRTKRNLNPKVLAMLPADVVASCRATEAQWDDESLFLKDDSRTKRQCGIQSAMPRLGLVRRTIKDASTKVETKLAPENDKPRQPFSLSHWPQSFTFDARIPDAPDDFHPRYQVKPWVRVCLYVDGEKKIEGHKLVKVERIASLTGLRSQFLNAYCWQLDDFDVIPRWDPIRFYIVRFGGGGTETQIEPNDEKAWESALESLHYYGDEGRTILKGLVEVHF